MIHNPPTAGSNPAPATKQLGLMPGMCMAESLNRPCPKPFTGLPEPKCCGYRESVRKGGLYVHELFAMGRVYEEKISIAADISAITAGHLRSVARCSLITEFWRFLGAA